METKIIKTNFGKEVKIFAETFEYDAYEQIKRIANYEAYKDSIIRIMPKSSAVSGWKTPWRTPFATSEPVVVMPLNWMLEDDQLTITAIISTIRV